MWFLIIVLWVGFVVIEVVVAVAITATPASLWLDFGKGSQDGKRVGLGLLSSSDGWVSSTLSVVTVSPPLPDYSPPDAFRRPSAPAAEPSPH
jgi:hypothetical protein